MWWFKLSFWEVAYNVLYNQHSSSTVYSSACRPHLAGFLSDMQNFSELKKCVYLTLFTRGRGPVLSWKWASITLLTPGNKPVISVIQGNPELDSAPFSPFHSLDWHQTSQGHSFQLAAVARLQLFKNHWAHLFERRGKTSILTIFVFVWREVFDESPFLL